MEIHRNLNRIVRVSRRTRWCVLALMIGIPIAAVWIWLWAAPEFAVPNGPPGLLEYGPLTDIERWYGVALAAFPVGLFIWALYYIQELLRFYASGKIFTAENATCFRAIARLTVAAAPVFILHRAAASVAFSLDAPPGEHQLLIGVGPHDIGLLLAGVLLLVISWVMTEAVRVSDENAAIV